MRLARIPALAGLGDSAAIVPLSGLTNRSYRIEAGGRRFVLRLPGAGTEAYLERAAEAHNARLAAGLGLGPELLFYDPDDGTMVTAFIEGGQALDAARLAEPGCLQAAAGTLARLHRSGASFRGERALFDNIEEYLRLAIAAGEPAPAQIGQTLQAAGPVRQALLRWRQPPAPCHIDPAPQNFIAVEGTGRMLLLDWEYAAMSEPVWDLAGLAAEAELGPEQERALLRAYWGAVTPQRLAHLVLYKAMLGLLAAAWAHLQKLAGSANADFAAMAEERLGRSRRILQGPELAGHLAALAG